MTAVRSFVLLAASAALVVSVGSRPASAQIIGEWSEQGFVTVNGGAQTNARSVRTTGDTPVFGESATWESTIGVGRSSIFDINGGYRVWRNLAAALGVSTYSDSSSSVLNASIPDPLFFDQPRAASTTVGGLEHRETALHLSAAYVMPLTDKIDATVMAGPTWFFVRKDVVGDITLSGESLSGATRERIEETAVGGHFTIDVRYRVLTDVGMMRSLGVGIFLRYSGASIDGGSAGVGSIDVGGFNYGAGLRIGF